MRLPVFAESIVVRFEALVAPFSQTPLQVAEI